MRINDDTKKIVKSLITDPPIRTAPISEISVFFTQLINRTHANTGISYNPDLVALTIEELATDMSIQYGYLRKTEIQQAFKNGYREIYGKFFGLNNATYFKWVQAYVDSEEFKFSRKLSEQVKNTPKIVEPTEKEKNEIIINGIIYAFNGFKNTGDSIVPSAYYDFLQRNLIIDFPLADREKFKLEAMRQIIAEKNQEKIETGRNLSIKNYIENLNGNNHDVISRGKQLAVKSWFAKLINEGTDIENALKKS